MKNKKEIKRKEIQEQALKRSKLFNFLLLSFATGVGKTYASLIIAVNDIKQNKNNKWAIAVEETSTINNWKKEFEKHNLSKFLDNFTFTTYASIKNIKCNNWILDECHHAISDSRINYIKSNNLRKIVALSATMSSEKKEKLNKIRQFHEYKYTLNQAITDGVLPAPKIYVKEIYLDNSKKTFVYNKKKGAKNKRIKKECDYKDYKKILLFNKEIDLNISCTAKQYYELISEDIENAKQKYAMFKQKWAMFTFLNLASKRKLWIANYKTEELNNLIKEKKTGKRYIVFSGSISQAKKVQKYNNVIHSKLNDKENEELISKFNNKKINSLFCVKKLREGVNLAELDFGIITQIDSTSLSFIQMMGRSLRSENPEVYLLIVKDTQDEKYFEKIKNELNEKYFEKI